MTRLLGTALSLDIVHEIQGGLSILQMLKRADLFALVEDYPAAVRAQVTR